MLLVRIRRRGRMGNGGRRKITRVPYLALVTCRLFVTLNVELCLVRLVMHARVITVTTYDRRVNLRTLLLLMVQ